MTPELMRDFAGKLRDFQLSSTDGEEFCFPIDDSQRIKLTACTRWSFGSPTAYVRAEYQELDGIWITP